MRLTLLLGLPAALIVLGLPAAAAAPEGPTRYALVVGNNLGTARAEPLRYAEQDARRVAGLLGQLGGVRAENIELVLGGGPDEVRGGLDRLVRRMASQKGEALFFFYYSGHADSGFLRLGDASLGLEELRRRLERVPAGVRVAIIDACQSGEITRAKGGAVTSPFLEERPVTARGLVILTSASSTENAQESEQLGSSFFSHHLISGLRGAADRSRDGRVTVSEAYEHAYRATVRETSGSRSGAQHPTFLYALEGEGEIAITDVGAARARIDLGDDLDGTVLVVADDGRIEVETQKAAGEPLSIALPTGRFEIRRRAEGQLYAASVRLVDGEILRLQERDFIEVELATTTAKGGPGSDAEPLASTSVPRRRPAALTAIPLGGGPPPTAP